MQSRFGGLRGALWLSGWACLTALAGCAGAEEGDEPTGAVKVMVTRSALSAGEVRSISTTVSSAALGKSLAASLGSNGTQWTGFLDLIPVGTDWKFEGKAIDWNGAEVYAGAVEGVTIEADRTAFVSLNLDQLAPAVPFVNSAPRIQAVTASAIEVQPTDRIALSVTGVDADGDTLTYTWSAADGSFASINNNRASWTSPRRKGVYPIQVQVTDTHGLSATANLSIEVLTTIQEGSAEIAVGFNTFPEVFEMQADVTRIDVGQTVVLGVSASDPDFDGLSYAWTTGCEGSFDAADVAAPSFTLSALPELGTCTFEASISDGRGGKNTGTLTIAAGPEPEVVVAPQVPVALTQVGEAYVHNGTCEGGWNRAGNAETLALWACQANGYDDLVSYGATGVAETFAINHLLYDGPDHGILFNWASGSDARWCPLNAVSEIVCR